MSTVGFASRGSGGGAPADVRARLVRLLQDSHAGELAAAYAYRGHWRSLRRRPAARDGVRRIEEAEWHHRAGVAAMLSELGEGPRRRRELLMGCIGRLFGGLCFVNGFSARCTPQAGWRP